MKAVLPLCLAMLLLGSSSPVTLAANEASPPKVCLNVRNIQRTETPDDRTILFHMRDGTIWQNRLRQNCPSLRYSPFTQQLHTDQICSNQQFIHVALTGDTCALGDFTSAEPKR
jgi:hypothetical protein